LKQKYDRPIIIVKIHWHKRLLLRLQPTVPEDNSTAGGGHQHGELLPQQKKKSMLGQPG